MEPLLLVIALAGLLIGATGTWSPCGFSMIETIGPTGHTGGMRTTVAAAATFAPFAVLGGAITFGLVALAGQALLGAGGTLAFVVAAIVALAAAIAEARGARIVPQVRRQLPIGWRTHLPMPIAAAGYGVLLGLGFTTFVLSYGVWALMGICLALGDPLAGLVAGVAFGVGRALPIVALAPLADRPSGERACEAMAMRPGLLRGARAGDAVALSAVAAVLLGGAGAAGAASREVANASDPSLAGPALAYELRPNRAIVEEGGTRSELPGSDPALGGRYAATIRDDRISIFLRTTGAEIGSVPASRADAVAISRDWLAYRQRTDGRDVISAASIADPAAPGAPYRVGAAKSPSQLSRPAVDGRRIVYALARRGSNSLVAAKLRPGSARAKERILTSRSLAIAGPSIDGRRIAYVASRRGSQSVRVKGFNGGAGHVVLRRRPGPPTLWTTALGERRVYVTLVGAGGRGRLISARR